MLPTYIYKHRPDGSVESVTINKVKRHVRSFWVLGVPKTVTLIGASEITVPYIVDTQGHFEWAYIMARQDNPQYLVRIFDQGTRRDLMNEFIHAATLVGTARRPALLPETYLLNTENAARELDITFRGIAFVPTNNIEFVLHGRRWYHKEAPPDVQIELRKKFESRERTTSYWLTTKGGGFTIPGGGSLVHQAAPIIEADDEADTEVFKVTAFSTGSFEFQLREIASNRTLMNDFVRVENGFGSPEFPFIFQESLLIERNYDVAVDVRDLSGEDNDVFITFWSRRLWYR